MIIVALIVILANSVVTVMAAVVTLVTVMSLLHNSRNNTVMLDQILAVVRELGKIVELAIWRG